MVPSISWLLLSWTATSDNGLLAASKKPVWSGIVSCYGGLSDTAASTFEHYGQAVAESKAKHCSSQFSHHSCPPFSVDITLVFKRKKVNHKKGWNNLDHYQ